MASETEVSITRYPDFGSTGYLEDALVEFSIRFKRRRFLSQNSSSSSSSPGYSSDTSCDFNLWAENCSFDVTREDISQTTNNSQCLCLPDRNRWYENFEAGDAAGEKHEEMGMTWTSSTSSKRKRSMSRRLAYPFGMVKPGGIKGDLTLEEINKSIMKAPTRPVRHPVGNYVCPPAVASFRGPGLSGKAVVAFTRTHTKGTGSVTIIRTKD